MTSYADVAAKDAPPASTADPVFLDGSYNTAPTDGHGAAHAPSTALPDVDSRKVNVVPAGTDLRQLTTQTESDAQQQQQQQARDTAQHAEQKTRQTADKLAAKADDLQHHAKHNLNNAEKKVAKAADSASRHAKEEWHDFASDPRKWLASLGAVNLILLGGAGIAAYTHRDTIKTWDRRFIASLVAGIGAVVGIQAYFGADKAKQQSARK